ncbi:tetratricopeptide repeat protein [Pedobacter sp. HMF7647]|uniref:Tetratricopeptide repeat protein n=1 Tax=Hufsiella arboris TaxID=2695275 RepID=A0A7K1YE64_9SPHI|nr:histidine kinase [Hufsiella arboris]MXV52896.1 tetratricopeptide repeat protein [Hufsiella arboris]
MSLFIRCIFCLAIVSGCCVTVVRAETQSPRWLSDTAQVTRLLGIAGKKTGIGETDSAEYYIRKAGKLAAGIKSPKSQIKYFAYYANFLFDRLRYQEALDVSKEQLKVSRQVNDLKSAANAYNNMAIQYGSLGQLETASKCLIQALKISEQTHDLLNQRKFYNNLATIFLDLNDQKNSLFYASKSYELARKLKDTMQLARSLTNLALSEVISGRYDRAISYQQLQLDIAKRKGYYDLVMDASVNLGETYIRKKEYPKALAQFAEAEKVLQKNPDEDYKMYIHNGFASAYYHLGNYRLAKAHLDRMFEQAKMYMPKIDLKNLYRLAAEIHEKLNDPEKGLALWKKYNDLNDSIISANTQKAIHEAEIRYQTNVKEKAIAQQKLLISNKNLEIQKKDQYILVSIMIIVLLLSISVIIFLIYKNKNQVVQLSLLKAQIHPHFLFNTLNNLYALSLSKSDESPAVIMGLSKILRYMLYECNAPKVSLQKEIDIIEQYISLEKIRYHNRLEVNMDINGDLESQQITPLLILPLVENAFKHGISKLVDNGWIKIETQLKQSKLIFKISNNKLAEAEFKEKQSRFGNIGLLNIKRRLKILYRGRHQLRIIDEDELFMVIMKISL